MNAASILGGVALAALAGQALAADLTFGVTGFAPEVCAVQAPELSDGPTVNIRNLSGGTLQIDSLVDPQTLATRAAQAQISFDAVCTYPHQIRIESRENGLWRNQVSGVTRPQGFADGVPYTASLNWGQDSGDLFADASSRGAALSVTPIGAARSGVLTIDVSIQPGASNLAANSPLLAGVYSDTLIITLEPQ